METIFITFNRYILIILMTVYSFQCFSVFRYKTEEERDGIYIRQDVAMTLIYLLSFIQLYIMTGETELIMFYAVTQLLLWCTILLYRLLYPEANKLLVNNMCMLISVGFIILVRLDYQKAKKQFMVVLVSLIMAVIIPFILKTFKRLRRFYWLLSAAGIAALSAVLFFSNTINGSKLNIKIGGISFQASEFVKIIFVFAMAGILTCADGEKGVKRHRIAAAVAGIHVLLLVASKDLGSAIIFYMVFVIMLFVGMERYKYLILGLAGAAVCSVAGYMMFSHVRVRVEAWKDPLGTIETSGYQIAQSLFAIGTGGFTGMGLYNGAPNRIPVVEADFIFAAISEEFGVMFGICLILI
ncbi:MAG: FtsW/RodA/SpoVE family cell cycle protein, partial [Lachnospiraceae bacterium]|nr:FtsW/RodA/SpoVE family cell cycle protein [Lachnospiraceae bacterium]